MNEHEMLDRLRDFANKMGERLTESEALRARLENARREFNRWPEMQQGSRRVGDIPELPYFRPPDDETH